MIEQQQDRSDKRHSADGLPLALHPDRSVKKGKQMEPLLLFGGVIVLAIIIRLVAGSFDAERVERYVREQGWELVDRSWDPFGPGWFGEKDSRIYQIAYRDQQGSVHRAHVKTSMLSGVYLTNDHVVQPADHPRPAQEQTLAEENRRLRDRIRELEQGKT